VGDRKPPPIPASRDDADRTEVVGPVVLMDCVDKNVNFIRFISTVHKIDRLVSGSFRQRHKLDLN